MFCLLVLHLRNKFRKKCKCSVFFYNTTKYFSWFQWRHTCRLKITSGSLWAPGLVVGLEGTQTVPWLWGRPARALSPGAGSRYRLWDAGRCSPAGVDFRSSAS